MTGTCLKNQPIYSPQSLEPVRQCRAPFSGVGELAGAQRVRHGVAGNAQGTCVLRIETRAAAQLQRRCERIDGAAHASTPNLQYMGINHRRRHVGVTKQILDAADVIARLQQVGGK